MTQEDNDFDFQAALKAIQAGKPLLGKEGILTPLIKNLTEAALEGELDSHLGREIAANRVTARAKRLSSHWMVILNSIHLVTGQGPFLPSWSRNIKRRSVTKLNVK